MPKLPFACPVVFPLFGINGGKCACSNDSCNRVGKHPACDWGDLKYGDPVPRKAPGAGIGIKTGAAPFGSDCIGVDVDSPEALELFAALGECPETYTVATPRGWHIYFQHPGFRVRNSAGDLAKGVDIRGDGGFLVSEGSPHKSGVEYTCAVDAPLAPAPAWLIDWLKSRPAAAEAQVYPGDVTGAERHYHRGLYSEYLLTAPPCVEGAAGDEALRRVVQHGAYDLLLPVDDVLELVQDIFDPRCEPPWGDALEERVHHNAHRAKTLSTRPRVVPLPWDLKHYASAPAELPTFGKTNNSNKPETTGECLGSLGEKWGGWDSVLFPPGYLLEGLIPEGKVVTFFAEGGSVKTWSALALAIAVASGEPWLGKYGVRKGRVLFLDYEDGPFEMNRRVRMLTHGKDVPDLGYLYGGPQISRIEFWKALAEKVESEGITLIVVDSLGAGMPGDADENTTAFAEGMKIAGRFTETGCTVLFVHHANKTGGMRGTSAARDQSDVVFKFEPVSETDAVKRMRMICDKPGPQKRPAPVNVQLSDAGLTTFEDEANDLGRNATGARDAKAAVLLAIASESMVPAKIARVTGLTGYAVRQAIRELGEEGSIVSLGYHDGYVADDDGRRRARVFETVQDFVESGTCADLAEAAAVPTKLVERLVKAKAITYRTGKNGGGFLVNNVSDLAGVSSS